MNSHDASPIDATRLKKTVRKKIKKTKEKQRKEHPCIMRQNSLT
jgi:hypothetical protein